jgi:hypothetical protein
MFIASCEPGKTGMAREDHYSIIPTLLGLSIPSIKRQGALHSKGEVSIGVGRTKFTVDRQG